MLTENQVELIAAIGRMFYVLAFLAGEGRPLRAREIATRLRTEYETVRNYLAALDGLRVAARTARGWTATRAGQALVFQIAGLPTVWVSENAGKTRPAPRIARGSRANAEIPPLPPFIIVNSEPSLNFGVEESLTITSAERAGPPRFLDENRGDPAFQAGDPEPEPEPPPDPAAADRLEALAQALHAAGIRPNNRTRPLFKSDFLTAAHVAGYASRLHGYYGSGYRTNILVGVLESLRPGDPAPERGASLADIVCPACHCSPCACEELRDYAEWEE